MSPEYARPLPAPEPGQVDVVVDYVPAPGRTADLVAALRRNIARVDRTEPDHVGAVVHEREDGSVLTVSRWRDERALQAHLTTMAAADVVESFVGLLAEPIVPRVVRPRLTPPTPPTPPGAPPAGP